MPPKGWTSGRPEGIVKAVRLTEETIERVARHIDRLQQQLSFVRVNEGMAIRNLIEAGLDAVEAREAQPWVSVARTPSPPAPETSPLVPHETLTPEPKAPPAVVPQTPALAPDLDPEPETNPPQPEKPSMAPPGMKQCKHGHEFYSLTKTECPTCARNRMRRKRQPQTAPQPQKG